MFAKSLIQVKKYTLPVVVSTKLFNGEISCGCGTFIILNEEGWILTAAHLLDAMLLYNQHQIEIGEYERKIQEIELDNKLDAKQKHKRKQKLSRNPKWIKNISYWWGCDEFTINSSIFDKTRDLALCKIESFNKECIASYPIFKNPSIEMLTGTSLCKLGFPFNSITATFDESLCSFKLAEGTLPMPFFPLEGMYTRNVHIEDELSGKTSKYLETSTPGLRGQSGGPIFDVHGNIWAIQSCTINLPLGFSPSVKSGNKIIQENQFLNVSLGTHVEEIVNFLNENNINFHLSKE